MAKGTLIALALSAALAACARADGGEEACAFDRAYVGAAGSLALPGGGGDLRRLGGGVVRAGYYVAEAFALEGEAGVFEDRAALAARGLVHFRAWREFDLLFGYERLDPFITVGARGWFDRGDAGPALGLGAFYYLSDAWALRFDAEATRGVERADETVYALSFGVQYAF